MGGVEPESDYSQWAGLVGAFWFWESEELSEAGFEEEKKFFRISSNESGMAERLRAGAVLGRC